MPSSQSALNFLVRCQRSSFAFSVEFLNSDGPKSFAPAAFAVSARVVCSCKAAGEKVQITTSTPTSAEVGSALDDQSMGTTVAPLTVSFLIASLVGAYVVLIRVLPWTLSDIEKIHTGRVMTTVSYLYHAPQQKVIDEVHAKLVRVRFCPSMNQDSYLTQRVDPRVQRHYRILETYLYCLIVRNRYL